jgi:hypothetical protein
MTTATLPLFTRLPATRSKPKKGLLARMFDAMVEARMRQAVREIAHRPHLVPEDLLKKYGYEATVKNDGAYPFTR